MTFTIVPEQDWQSYDEMYRAVAVAPEVLIEVSGRQFSLPREMIDVVARAADLFAGGRAVDVVSQARSRFF